MKALAVICRSVKICIRFIIDIAVNGSAHIHKKVMLCPVVRCTVNQTMFFAGRLNFACHISFRTHINRIPSVQFCIIHCKTVMMLCNRHNIFSTAFFKKRNPFIRIKMFALKHRDEILITKILMFAIGINVVPVLTHFFIIHISGIPFITKGRHTVNAPMNKNSEFSIMIPFWCFMRAK